MKYFKKKFIIGFANFQRVFTGGVRMFFFRKIKYFHNLYIHEHQLKWLNNIKVDNTPL